MKFFIVSAICGHCGSGKGVIKDFTIKANSKSEAAAICRYKPRVKHDNKAAIRDVEEVSFEEYLRQAIINNNDPYFTCFNSSEQKALCSDMALIDCVAIVGKKIVNGRAVKLYHGKSRISERTYTNRYQKPFLFINPTTLLTEDYNEVI